MDKIAVDHIEEFVGGRTPEERVSEIAGGWEDYFSRKEVDVMFGTAVRVLPEIPDMPNAHITNLRYGGLEIENKNNKRTGRYRYFSQGPGWKRKRPQRWWEFWRWGEGDHPYRKTSQIDC